MDKYKTEAEYQKVWVNTFRDNKHLLHRYWKELRRLDTLIAVAQINNDTKILDIGCGISTVLHYLPGEKFGIDSLAASYHKWYKYPDDMDIKQGHAEKLPFANSEFDVVITSNALDHVSDISKSIDEIHRTLKTGGYFICVVEVFPVPTQRDEAHPYSLTKTQLWDLFRDEFQMCYTKEAPMIGLEDYINYQMGSFQNEVIWVMRKI